VKPAILCSASRWHLLARMPLEAGSAEGAGRGGVKVTGSMGLRSMNTTYIRKDSNTTPTWVPTPILNKFTLFVSACDLVLALI